MKAQRREIDSSEPLRIFGGEEGSDRINHVIIIITTTLSSITQGTHGVNIQQIRRGRGAAFSAEMACDSNSNTVDVLDVLSIGLLLLLLGDAADADISTGRRRFLSASLFKRAPFMKMDGKRRPRRNFYGNGGPQRVAFELDRWFNPIDLSSVSQYNPTGQQQEKKETAQNHQRRRRRRRRRRRQGQEKKSNQMK